MPNIGEIRGSREAGHKSRGKYIWAVCTKCGKGRWIRLGEAKRGVQMCRSCWSRINFVLAQQALKANPPNLKMEAHPHWKGGRHIDRYGYVWLRLRPDDPYHSMANHNGYVNEHRLVVAHSLGRCLTKLEMIHHLNGNRKDNRQENLQLTTSGQHPKGYEKGYQYGFKSCIIQLLPLLLKEGK